MLSVPEYASWLDVRKNMAREKVRNRVLHGGRGAGKSWTIAAKLVEKAMRRPLQILCAREFQNSLRDSSKRLLEDQIAKLGADGRRFFTITEQEIRGRNGSRFLFMGLNGREASIKSLEGIDIAWIEEAATISQSSIDALTPTIRRDDSELWWSYNPRFPNDPVDRMFRGEEGPPPGTVLVEVHHRDNRWFPDVLRAEMEFDRARNPDKHRHIWEGDYDLHSDAKVFTNWWRMLFDTPPDAMLQFGADWGFGPDPTVLVRSFIGRWEGVPGVGYVVADPAGDCLFVDHEIYVIGAERRDLPSLLGGSDEQREPRWANRGCHRGIPGARHLQIVADSSRPDIIRDLQHYGFNIVGARKGPGSIEAGIDHLKNFKIYVHPRCPHTVEELTHYRYKINRLTNTILSQLPDRNNHVIDALRYAHEGVRLSLPTDIPYATSGPSEFSAGIADYQASFRPSWFDPIADAQRRGEAANLRRILGDGYGHGW